MARIHDATEQRSSPGFAERALGLIRAPGASSLMLACALAACAGVPPRETLELRNRQHHDDALLRARARFGGEAFAPEAVWLPSPEMRTGGQPEGQEAEAHAPTPLDVKVTGQRDGDQLYRFEDGTLGFSGPACFAGSSCGCETSFEYLYVRRPGGAVAIVRIVPDVKAYIEEVDSCGFGCGQPSPPAPISVARLGITRPEQIEIGEEHTEIERVVQHCDHPIPLP